MVELFQITLMSDYASNLVPIVLFFILLKPTKLCTDRLRKKN